MNKDKRLMEASRATEAMGDPHAVRGQLRRVHRPVLTWLLRIFRVVL